ncbi:hypothetical protein RirG_062400 [Rhizophagus irregularis DAOM 197198w]|uniref:Uncharacterized protein n=1 Tax=Rhizophagus irregularis (strain DAOM 197198w) TaxID=1432141 RepID=A0A015L030_RHIIW|nr:hypothetical protein RirG_062400 [Rhizophagus irregularis DAOM 197198w]
MGIPYYIVDYIEKKKAKSSGIEEKKLFDLIGALANGSSSRAGESAIIEKSIILDSDSCENTIQQVFKNR